MPSREHGHRRGSKPEDEEYVIVVKDVGHVPRVFAARTERTDTDMQIPRSCKWQEFKDLVRQTATHVRQSVVYETECGDSTRIGQITVRSRDEAFRTYSLFYLLSMSRSI